MQSTSTHNDLAGRLRRASADLSVDAKRKPHCEAGVESWYPYYAGFSESFARRVLGAAAGSSTLCIMDPWNGCGTTTRVAHDMGHHALGFDLNPVANIVASAKIAHPDDVLHVAGLARRLASVPALEAQPEDPLLAWLAPSVVGQYRGLEASILAELGTTSGGETAKPVDGGLPPLASFLLLALIRTARELASVQQGSNPTWIRPGRGRKSAVRTLGTRWTARLAEMADELGSASHEGRARPWAGRIGVADSRLLPVDDGAVDLVLTSPPYCTRIDYVVSASFELAALGLAPDSERYHGMRRATMGTPLARKGEPPEIPAQWPRPVASLLRTIRAHPSKASRSYYYKTYWQYFDDASMSLGELHRTMRPKGLALLVVQSSYYKDLRVDLPGLYLSLAETAGFHGSLFGETHVRRALAQINPRVAQHRQDADYREALIALEKA